MLNIWSKFKDTLVEPVVWKANYLRKNNGYSQVSLWIPKTLAESYFFSRLPNHAEISLFLVGPGFGEPKTPHRR